MQLVCPACSARYLISPAALGEGGKDVRCAKCDHQWFQVAQDVNASIDDTVDNAVDNLMDNLGGDLENDLDPVQEESFDDLHENEADNSVVDSDEDKSGDSTEDSTEDKSEDESEDNLGGASSEDSARTNITEDDIPEGVKPTDDSKKVPAFAEDVIRPKVGKLAKLTGFATAAAIFGLVISAGLIFKKQVISAWVPAVAIYEMIGMPIEFQGKNLVIENLSAQSQRDVDGQNYLLLQGRVINLTNEVQPVPQLYARLRSTNGIDGKGWEIEPSLERLQPGESFMFQSDYPALPEGTGSVNLSFLPTVQ
jgi:predicted Zn finger-like uncharacterized protein